MDQKSDRLPLAVSYRFVNWNCMLTWSVCQQLLTHNFQRRMSRLEQRWRAQRSVISIVNCRIPWTNRDLNVYCAFGTCLKACLLQRLLIKMPQTTPCHMVKSCARLVRQSAWSLWRIESKLSYLNCAPTRISIYVAALVAGIFLCLLEQFHCSSPHQDMKLGQQTRWI